MGLNFCEKAEFLVSTLQDDSFKAIMYVQRATGELSFKEIGSRLESRYEGDSSTVAAAWMKLDQAFQQRKELLFQWSDRLDRIKGVPFIGWMLVEETQLSQNWSRSFASRLGIAMQVLK